LDIARRGRNDPFVAEGETPVDEREHHGVIGHRTIGDIRGSLIYLKRQGIARIQTTET